MQTDVNNVCKRNANMFFLEIYNFVFIFPYLQKSPFLTHTYNSPAVVNSARYKVEVYIG